MAHRSLSVQERGWRGTARTEVPYFCKEHAFPWGLKEGGIGKLPTASCSLHSPP